MATTGKTGIKEMADLKKRLAELQARRTELEKQMKT